MIKWLACSHRCLWLIAQCKQSVVPNSNVVEIQMLIRRNEIVGKSKEYTYLFYTASIYVSFYFNCSIKPSTSTCFTFISFVLFILFSESESYGYGYIGMGRQFFKLSHFYFMGDYFISIIFIFLMKMKKSTLTYNYVEFSIWDFFTPDFYMVYR